MATTQSVANQTAIETFAQSLRGRLLRRGDPGYDEARRVHNGMYGNRHPDLLVHCAGVADVIAAVKLARSENIPVAVKGGGHSVPGYSGIEGGMLIDLSGMRSVRVDPGARTARAEGGCLLGDLDHETQAFGFAVTTGQVSHTGLAGLTLGGGWGFLTRKCGYTVDSLKSVDLVTADGELIRASDFENADLFWGIRGAGTNFGVVTSFEFHLHPIGPIVTGGLMLFPPNDAASLLRFWRDFMLEAPDELTTQFIFLTLPPAPFVAEEARGSKAIGIAVCYCGALDEAPKVLAPLRAFRTPVLDMVGPIQYEIQQRLTNDLVPHGLNYYTKGGFMAELPDEAIDIMAEVGPTSPSPMSNFGIFSLGGAIGRVPEDATAMGTRNARFSNDIISVWRDPAMSEENIAWTRSAWEAVQRFGTGSSYVNLMGEQDPTSVRRAYNSRTYQRLAALKAKCDPTNFFNRNPNIEPAAK